MVLLNIKSTFLLFPHSYLLSLCHTTNTYFSCHVYYFSSCLQSLPSKTTNAMNALNQMAHIASKTYNNFAVMKLIQAQISVGKTEVASKATTITHISSQRMITRMKEMIIMMRKEKITKTNKTIKKETRAQS